MKSDDEENASARMAEVDDSDSNSCGEDGSRSRVEVSSSSRDKNAMEMEAIHKKNEGNNSEDEEEHCASGVSVSSRSGFAPYSEHDLRYEQNNLVRLICRGQNASSIIEKEGKEGEGSWRPLHKHLTFHRDTCLLKLVSLQPVPSSTDGTNAVHLICKQNPPADIIGCLVSICPEAFGRADNLGRLPLHYACHHGCDAEALGELVGVYPGGCSETDALGRTPLHFAVGDGSKEERFGADVVGLLVRDGAAAVRDRKWMLPLHYACAYGAKTEVLQILIAANPTSITATDSKRLTPLHYVCGNCERAASPLALHFLLSTNPDLVNFDANHDAKDECDLTLLSDQTDDALRHSALSSYLGQRHRGHTPRGHHPLHALANRASNFKPSNDAPELSAHRNSSKHLIHHDSARTNAQRCLDIYLKKKPRSTPEFLIALQALPEWLRDRAVVHPTVKNLLNESMVHRVPTAVVMLDLYAHLAIIITYFLLVVNSIDNRHNSPDDDASVSPMHLLPMYVGAGYFTLRFVLKIISFLSLNLLHKLLQYDKTHTNLMDILFLALTYFWAIVLTSKGLDEDFFRWGVVITLLIFWCVALNFLRNLLFDFAVFVSGVVHVFKDLTTFLLVLCIVLFAFMMMFYTTFMCTGDCEDATDTDTHTNITNITNVTNITNITNTTDDTANDGAHDGTDNICPNPSEAPFCTFWESFLTVFTMLLGEVEAEYFEPSLIATVLFVLFVFLVVILLANVLIAIVTDSYGVIRKERAAVEFWSHRLAFVIQMDVICSGLWNISVSTDTAATSPPPHTPLNKNCSDSYVNNYDENHNDNVSFEEDKMAIRTPLTRRQSITSRTTTSTSTIDNKNISTTTNDTPSPSPFCSSAMFSDLWTSLLDFFDDESYLASGSDDDKKSKAGLGLRFLILFLRITTAVVVIPVWMILGFLTAGLVWPPQVRKWILQQTDYGAVVGGVVGGSGGGGGGGVGEEFGDVSVGLGESEQRRMEVEGLQEDVQDLKDNFAKEMKKNRDSIKEIRSDLVLATSELSQEIEDIKGMVLRLAKLHESRGDRPG